MVLNMVSVVVSGKQIKFILVFFFFSSRRRHTRCYRDWSSDVCSSDARLEELWVEPAWRGRLVGTRLLLVAGERLRAAGVRRLSASPNRLHPRDKPGGADPDPDGVM